LWHAVLQNKDENPGFYLFGKVAESLGAKITSLKEAPTADTLKDLSVYIIVDPDNTLDNPTPNYISVCAAVPRVCSNKGT
jgi:unsaturated rhamnogalacturonyl hydrolase